MPNRDFKKDHVKDSGELFPNEASRRGPLFEAFCEHPQSVGETYLQHMKFAVFLGLRLIIISICLLIHGVFPFIFKSFSGDQIISLATKIQQRRIRGSKQDLDCEFQK